jgi:hypothetical protein
MLVLIDEISEFAWEWKVWAFSRGDGQAGHFLDGGVEGGGRPSCRLFSHEDGLQ